LKQGRQGQELLLLLPRRALGPFGLVQCWWWRLGRPNGLLLLLQEGAGAGAEEVL
jgi:hypothetical protein